MQVPSRATQARGNVAFRWRQAQGEYVRSLRESRGLTQSDPLDALGITSKQMISAIENARVNFPPDWVEMFAEVLKVPVQEFAKTLLRYQNPFLYAAIFGADAALAAELEQASDRVASVKAKQEVQ